MAFAFFPTRPFVGRIGQVNTKSRRDHHDVRWRFGEAVHIASAGKLSDGRIPCFAAIRRACNAFAVGTGEKRAANLYEIMYATIGKILKRRPGVAMIVRTPSHSEISIEASGE